MKSALLRSTGLLTLLAVFGFGCGSTSSGDGSTTTTTPQPNQAVNAPLQPAAGQQPGVQPEPDGAWRLPGRGTSLCDHPYYPLRPGYRVSYRNEYIDPDLSNTNGRRATAEYTLGVEGVSGNTATLKYSFRTPTVIEATQTIRCLPEGLTAEGYVDLSALRGGRGTAVRTLTSTGLVFPRDVRIGSSWDQSYTFETKLPGDRLQPRLTDVKGTVQINRKALSEQSVTTAAGTFTALYVESRTESIMDFPGGGAVTIRSVGQEWWVRGKGLVRAEHALVDGNGASLSEATAITTP